MLSHIIRFSNLLVYVFLLTTNLLTIIYSGLKAHDTYITPHPSIFLIWAVIIFLFGGLVIYQFFDRASETVVDGIHGHFITISLFSALWVYLWETNHLILALITITIIFSQISFVYWRLHNKFPAQGINDTLWIHAPFSLYHAWSAFLLILSIFAAFTPEKTDDEDSEQPKLYVKILVFFALLILQGVASSYIEGFKGDVAGALVIAGSLYGVFVAQDDPFIHWSALFFAVCTSIHIFKPFVKKYFLGRSAEHAPLLG